MGYKKCIHGKRLYVCVDCGGKGICKHGKQKATCKECGGKAFCEHGKQKAQCRECGGKSFCEHGKFKVTCRECGGKSFCEHGKFKALCKECGGKGICKHGKNKRMCKECGGKGICKHGKQKSRCKECGGSSICEHGKVKRTCKECGGSSICEHGKFKAHCKECGGSSFCEHGKIKRMCRECNGSAFCEHGKQKTQCRECGGSSICEHGKFKARCKECGGTALCKTPMCETVANKKYNGHCMRCFVNLFPELKNARNYKTKERNVVDNIKKAFPDYSWFCDKTVQDGCSLKRPDMLLDMGSHAIIVEVDENQHVNYDCSCENKRLMELSQDVDHRPIVFIRFNPDKYFDKDGNKVDSCWEATKQGILRVAPKKQQEWEHRLECLVDQIQYWIENETNKTVEVVELFYDAN